MAFFIADSFTDSLAKLTGDEQKLVKQTAFDLQMDPASPGFSFHKLDKARDKNFWSVRAGSDIRLIVHRTAQSLLLCYVDHHDKAYAWAERRKLETHPTTGAAQMVEIRETVVERPAPEYIASGKGAASPLFSPTLQRELLEWGVPEEWLPDVFALTSHDDLLELVTHLPAEAGEALLDLAIGAKPKRQPVLFTKKSDAIPDSVVAFIHPDAMRRFRLMDSADELQRALDFPWEKWTIFLHPDQRQWVERTQNGPAKVCGSAGTGKTVVALHRAAHLARSNPDSRVLLTTYTDTLAYALEIKLKYLMQPEPRLIERIDVHSLKRIALRLYRMHAGEQERAREIATPQQIQSLLQQAAQDVPGHNATLHFLRAEWEQVVDARQVATWEEYRDVPRLGRKTRLPETQRAVLWKIFAQVQAGLAEQNRMTQAGMFTCLAELFTNGKKSPFDFIVVDEAQDCSIAQLKFLAALGSRRPDSLFFAGDLGQRIFQLPFSWKSLGVDLRGRSHTLRVNYRTSHQIRSQADRLLDTEVSDVDGNMEKRGDVISAFNGPPPDIRILDDAGQEVDEVAAWLTARVEEGLSPHEIGVFVRSEAQLAQAAAAIKATGLSHTVLDEQVSVPSGRVALATMHLAKGLEFPAVVVMACNDGVIPSEERIENIGDEADLEDVYNTERHLLYVACTRARDHLLVTGVAPGSEFLDDMQRV